MTLVTRQPSSLTNVIDLGPVVSMAILIGVKQCSVQSTPLYFHPISVRSLVGQTVLLVERNCLLYSLPEIRGITQEPTKSTAVYPVV